MLGANLRLAPACCCRLSKALLLISGIWWEPQQGVSMKEDRIIADEPIELDPSELLGFSQVAKVSGAQGKPDDLGRLLSK